MKLPKSPLRRFHSNGEMKEGGEEEEEKVIGEGEGTEEVAVPSAKKNDAFRRGLVNENKLQFQELVCSGKVFGLANGLLVSLGFLLCGHHCFLVAYKRVVTKAGQS